MIRFCAPAVRRTAGVALLAALTAPVAFTAGEHAHGHGHGSAAAPAATPAVGVPGQAAQVTRTIEVVMNDQMRFVPASVQVKAGETVRFALHNQGALAHEMVLGALPDLKAHAEMMRQMPDMKHAEPNAVTLGAGERGAIVWQFTQAGTVDFACTLPGHMEAGMVGQVQVTR